MSDISFLPQSFREKEKEIKDTTDTEAPKVSMSMHVPESEEEEVEIIEVDASEVDQLLIGEPMYTRMYYKISLWIDFAREKLLKPRPIEEPPKTPPQFLKAEKGKPAAPPKPGMAPAPASVGKAPVTPSKPGIAPTPAPVVPKIIPPGAKIRRSGKRVRIIRRKKRAVHISLLDEELMRELHVNVPKRQFTLVFLTILFAVVFAGAYFLLDNAIVQAGTEQSGVQAGLADIRMEVKSEQNKWISFQDLEPRLIALDGLLNEHVSVSRVLQFLEEHTLESVSYSNFMMDADGKVNLSVKAQDMQAAARQLLVFEEAPEVVGVTSNAFTNTKGSSGSNETSFQLSIQFAPTAFHFSTATSSRQ